MLENKKVIAGAAVTILSLALLIWYQGWAGVVTPPGPSVGDRITTSGPDPVSLSIPTLQLAAPFVPLGLTADKKLEVPGKPEQVGWYIHRAKPGDIGPAVVVGHLDTQAGKPAVFAKLHQVKPGDAIMVARSDGSEAVFEVESVQEYTQDTFPTEQVYGPINYAGLRLVTCSGVYNKDLRHYSHNLIVFAKLVR
ncbi:MAG TPA: class F sortase [Patescibacteria group bacterium]|nr:class F sortase [Patescibacteria group bacterium]